jgi:hypothetical protein
MDRSRDTSAALAVPGSFILLNDCRSIRRGRFVVKQLIRRRASCKVGVAERLVLRLIDWWGSMPSGKTEDPASKSSHHEKLSSDFADLQKKSTDLP